LSNALEEIDAGSGRAPGNPFRRPHTDFLMPVFPAPKSALASIKHDLPASPESTRSRHRYHAIFRIAFSDGVDQPAKSGSDDGKTPLRHPSVLGKHARSGETRLWVYQRNSNRVFRNIPANLASARAYYITINKEGTGGQVREVVGLRHRRPRHTRHP
jgi:hypothetical protein